MHLYELEQNFLVLVRHFLVADPMGQLRFFIAEMCKFLFNRKFIVSLKILYTPA